MPTAENTNDVKPAPDSPAAAMAELASDGLPPWMTRTLELLKKYQNVFYAIATVALLSWAIVRFQKQRREAKLNSAWFELEQAQSVDALRALLATYQGLPVEPFIRLRIANKLLEEEKFDESLKEFGELKARFGETLPGKLAAQQEKTAIENKAWGGKEGTLEKKLKDLREAGKDEKPADPAQVKIDNVALPRIELDASTGRVLIELDEDDAPNATAAFLRQVEKGYYAKTHVYKVETGAVFMGDPMPDGSGPRGFTIPFESSKLPAAAGTVALVRDLPAEGQPDTDALKNTGSTRFVIFTGDVPQYAGKFLVVGRVVEGLDAVRKMQPIDEIRSARVVQKRGHPYLPKENAPEPPK